MPHIYKNQLQQYAQRELLGFPVYTTESDGPPHDPRFKSTVIVNEKSYGTLEFFPTRKEAEQAAAKVACQALLVDAAQETTNGGLYKNLLQEFAQKRGLRFPSYQTTVSGLSHKCVFVSTVEIEKQTFQGAEAKTKKQSEMYAAKVAYCTLTNRCLATKSSEVSCMDECPVADNLSQNIQPTATTKKHQDTSYEDPYLHAKRVKPSTESMDVNTPPPSNFPSIVSNVINSQVENSFSVLPSVDNSFHVPAPAPAHPVTERAVENEPLPLVNTPPPSNFPSIVPYVINSQVENSFSALPLVDNSSHVPAPAHPVIEQTVKNEPVLPVNTPPPSKLPSIASNVVNSQVENSFSALPPVDNSSHVPAPADPVIEQTVESEPVLPVNTPPPSKLPSIASNVVNSQVENSFSALPPVDNSSHVPAPADPVIEQTVESEPVLPVNTPPPSNLPSIASNVVNSQVENSFSALLPVDNSSHVPAPADPVIEQTAESELVLPVNTPPPSNLPSIASNVVNSHVENSFPTPVDPVTEQTVGNEPLLSVNTPSPSNFPSIVSNVRNSQVENSFPASVADPVAEQIIENEPLLQRTFKTLVFPRKSNLPVPEGATVMPFSDDQWVAYKIDQNQAPMV